MIKLTNSANMGKKIVAVAELLVTSVTPAVINTKSRREPRQAGNQNPTNESPIACEKA